MSDEILKDLNRVIEKYKDKVFCTGELNYVDMAKSCKLEIERLNNIINELENIIDIEMNEMGYAKYDSCLILMKMKIKELKGEK